MAFKLLASRSEWAMLQVPEYCLHRAARRGTEVLIFLFSAWLFANEVDNARADYFHTSIMKRASGISRAIC